MVNRKKDAQAGPATQSSTVSRAGIKTGKDFANLMVAVMSDVIEGRMTTDVSNAVCNAGGKLLKVAEMQYKYEATPKEIPKPASEKLEFILATGVDA